MARNTWAGVMPGHVPDSDAEIAEMEFHCEQRCGNLGCAEACTGGHRELMAHMCAAGHLWSDYDD